MNYSSRLARGGLGLRMCEMVRKDDGKVAMIPIPPPPSQEKGARGEMNQ